MDGICEATMSHPELRSFHDVIQDLANQFGIEYEIAESLILEFIKLNYFAITGREIDDSGLPKS
jgi:hypothetical protein